MHTTNYILKIVTVVHPNILFLYRTVTQNSLFFVVCSLHKHSYILPISPITPEHCCVTVGGIRVESRLVNGLKVWSHTLVER